MKDLSTHILLDLFDVNINFLTDVKFIEDTLVKSSHEAKATILHQFFHKFGGAGGVTGLVALAESHISIHTWPESNYASIDIYMCGKSQPLIAANYIKEQFKTIKFSEKIISRGTSSHN